MSERLVRDFVPGFVVSDKMADGATFRIAPENERLDLVLQKIVDEAIELVEDQSLEQLADLMEAIGRIMMIKNWKDEDLKVCRDKRRTDFGGYTRYFVMRPVV